MVSVSLFGRRVLSSPAFVFLAAALLSSPATAATLTRGPYLQLATPSSITIVFRTDAPGTARVRYGVDSTSLSQDVVGSPGQTQHVLALSGLSASTRYFYSVELDGQLLASGPEYTFRTHPTAGVHQPFRFFAWGDSGNASPGQYAVSARMNDEIGEPAFALILGDIIYPAGEAENYDPRYFTPYRELIRRMVVWPTIGNHDVGTAGGQPYLDAYFLPTNNPASTELYYSFDYGDAHFVCLDTHSAHWTQSTLRTAQLNWARADLAASTARWKFVFFHKPPYSGGTHSDAADVKTYLVPLVEEQNVDVVFAGHSHVYERSFLLHGGAALQNAAANYTKYSAANGTLYVVSGTAGQSGDVSAAHPLMAYQRGDTLGHSIIDVSGPIVRGYFLDSTGAAHDLFTLFKDVDTDPPRVTGVKAGPASSRVVITFDEPVASGPASGSAEDPARYAVSPAVPVLEAALGTDLRTVTLTTSPHPPGLYSLGIGEVQDRANPPNTVAAGTEVLYRFDGAVDAGVGPVDAGQPDAGEPDAGTPDAGEPDAGVGSWALTPDGTEWRHALQAPEGWQHTGFSDQAWTSGPGPLGYGEARVATFVPMQEEDTPTFYARRTFHFGGALRAIERLHLVIDYDDGFVAFLNGVELERRNVPAGATAATVATASHEPGRAEVFDVTAAASLLRATNVLAVEIHNRSTSSSDAFLDASLVARTSSTPYLEDLDPAPEATGVPEGTAIRFVLRDDTEGVSPSDVRVVVDGNVSDVQLQGSPHAWWASFQPPTPLPSGSRVLVEVSAVNALGLQMVPVVWTFQTRGEADAGVAHDGGPDGGAGPRDRCGCSGTSAPVLLAAAWLLLLATRRRHVRLG